LPILQARNSIGGDMKRLLCKLFGHQFRYTNRYYRCKRCKVLRWKLYPKPKAEAPIENGAIFFENSDPPNPNAFRFENNKWTEISGDTNKEFEE
jgi:hypothetical protein